MFLSKIHLSRLLFVFSLFFSSILSASEEASAPPASDIEAHIQAAEQGDPEAQYSLALRYIYGTGTRKDAKQGIFWLQKAIDQEYPKAVYRYAKLFEEGIAVPMNAKSAAEWYLKAAQLGIVGAQRKMGELYNAGKGVNKDPVQAYAWYNIATAASGAVQDKIHREYIGFNLSPAERDRAQGLSADLLKPKP
jgi:TPR repeat protein